MEDLLKSIGLSPFEVIGILIASFVAKEIWSAFKTYRLKASHDYFTKLLSDIEKQLEEFYLPLRERFLASKLLFNSSNQWLKDGSYDNSILQIESDDPEALRKIAVWKMFLPFNAEAESIMLNKSHRKNIADPTNYEAIIHHFVVWRCFEEARKEGLISYYDAEHILKFPHTEVEKCFAMCDELLKTRREIATQILNLGKSRKSKRLLINKTLKGDAK